MRCRGRWPFLCLCIFRLGRRKIFDKALFESRLHVELFLRSTVGKTQMERCPGALPQTPPIFVKKSPDSVKWAMMTYVDAGLFISLWGL